MYICVHIYLYVYREREIHIILRFCPEAQIRSSSQAPPRAGEDVLDVLVRISMIIYIRANIRYYYK